MGSAHLRSALLGVASGRDAQSCPRECACEVFHLLQCDAVAKNKGERYIAVSNIESVISREERSYTEHHHGESGGSSQG